MDADQVSQALSTIQATTRPDRCPQKSSSEPLSLVRAACDFCNGTGYYTPDVNRGHKLWGRAVPCPQCQDLTWRERHLERQSGLPRKLRAITFAHSRELGHQQNGMAAMRELITDGAGMLALVGAVGVGKTHILACGCNAVRASGKMAHYNTTARLLGHLRAAYAPDSPGPSHDSLWELMEKTYMLALDEFSVFSPTPWAEEKFRTLLAWRYEYREELITVLAGNLPLKQWPAWLSSRFRDAGARTIVMDGPDIRAAIGATK